MPGNELDIIAQREKLPLDRVDQGVVIAPRKVRPADRALKQDVANLRQTARCVEKTT